MAKVDEYGKIVWEDVEGVTIARDKAPCMLDKEHVTYLSIEESNELRNQLDKAATPFIINVEAAELNDLRDCSNGWADVYDKFFAVNPMKRDKMDLNIDIVVMEGAKVPKYAHDGDAGFDLYNNGEEFTLKANDKTVVVPTGIKVKVPKGFMLAVCSRSGLSAKDSIQAHNAPGVVDSTYTGEVGVILYNSGNGDYRVKKGERIAQGVILPVYRAVFNHVESLEATERGENGFGSTGTE